MIFPAGTRLSESINSDLDVRTKLIYICLNPICLSASEALCTLYPSFCCTLSFTNHTLEGYIYIYILYIQAILTVQTLKIGGFFVFVIIAYVIIIINNIVIIDIFKNFTHQGTCDNKWDLISCFGLDKLLFINML